jgi:hypothetical protein
VSECLQDWLVQSQDNVSECLQDWLVQSQDNVSECLHVNELALLKNPTR